MSAQPGPDVHLWTNYEPHPQAWDELFARDFLPHEHCQPLVNWLGDLAIREFQDRRHNADLVFINQGITFSVYADRRGVEKIFPFDLIPRPVSAQEWKPLEAGLHPAHQGASTCSWTTSTTTGAFSAKGSFPRIWC